MKSRNEIQVDLQKFWSIRDFVFIASVSVHPSHKARFFRNVRKENGERCMFPDRTPVSIMVPPALEIDENEEYRIRCFVAPDEKRWQLGKEFLLFVDTEKRPPEKYVLGPKEFVQSLRKDYEATRGIAKDLIIGSLKRLSAETNKKPETFIYELIQNADDYPDPNRGHVDVSFNIVSDYLILNHDGLPFRQKNVYAICTVDAGDKQSDPNKTGFKGIGFKSIFKFANYVWIKSGLYSFRFDQNFYTSKGIEIGWQVIPIWTETQTVPRIDFSQVSSPVNIVIKPSEGTSTLKNIERIFIEVFKEDERVLLFLRSVRSIAFQGFKERFTIKLNYDKWEISNLDQIEVPSIIRDELIRLSDRDDRIPEKFKAIEFTKITFATIKTGGKIAKTENAKLYAYLPTDWSFGFNFIVNGDYIPDGSRDRLYDDIGWNTYLFEETGFQFLKWIAELYLKYKSQEVYDIVPSVPKLLKSQNDRAKEIFMDRFDVGFRRALSSVAFIPDQSQELELINNLRFDTTGVFQLVPSKIVEALLLDDKYVHHSLSQSSSLSRLLKEYNSDNAFNWEHLVESMGDLIDWLKEPQNNVAFLKLLIEKSKLEDFESLEIFLDQQGNLKRGREIYFSFNINDLALLSFMEISVLHEQINSVFEEEQLGVLHYEPIDFIKHQVGSQTAAIAQYIAEKDNSVNFFTYLSRYYLKFDAEIIAKIKELRFHNVGGVLSEPLLARTHYFYSSDLQTLLEKKAFPENWYDLLHLDYLHGGDVSVSFWKGLGIVELDSSNVGAFLTLELVVYCDQFNEHYEALFNAGASHLIEGLNALLSFYFRNERNISPEEKSEIEKALSQLKTVSEEEELVYFSESYLSRKYTGKDDFENLSEAFPELRIHFLSEKFLESKTLSRAEWRDLFKKIGGKYDLFQFTKSDLLPGINAFDEQLIPATKLVFKYRNKLKDSLISSLQFPVLATSGKIEAKMAVLGNYYLQDPILDTYLVNKIDLPYEVLPDYSVADIAEWRSFFELLGVSANKDHLVYYKLMIFFARQSDFQEKTTHFEFVSSIYLLFKNGFFTSNRSLLMKLEILTVSPDKQRKFCPANQVFFSKSYKPIVDFDNMSAGKDFVFLSQEYLSLDDDLVDLKKFFRYCGVKDSFSFHTAESIRRVEVDGAYINMAENQHEYIRSNALRFANQHWISPWIEIPHLDLILEYDFAKLFWDTILADDQFRYAVFNKIKYHCALGIFKVMSYPLFYICKNAVIPTKEGLLATPKDLYAPTLSSVVEDDSRIPSCDFSELRNEEGESLYSLLGIKQVLDVTDCLLMFYKEKTISWLRQQGIIERLSEIFDETLGSSEAEKLKQFITDGKIPSQTGNYTSIQQLYYLENFDIGIAKNRWLIHDDLKKFATVFDLQVLSRDDFEFNYKDEETSTAFQSRLLSRCKFFSLAEKTNEWEIFDSQLREKISQLTFHSVSQISLTYQKNEVLIEKNDLEFYETGSDVFFLGSWDSLTAEEMHSWLKNSYFKLKMSMKDYHQILIKNNDAAVVDYLKSQNIEIPNEWIEIEKTAHTVQDQELMTSLDHTGGQSQHILMQGSKEKLEYDGNETSKVASEPASNYRNTKSVAEDTSEVVESAQKVLPKVIFEKLRRDVLEGKVSFKQSKLEKNNATINRPEKIKPKPRHIISDQRKVEIGEVGEILVFHKLSQDGRISRLKWHSKYAEKHGETSFGDDSLGYDFSFIDLSDNRTKYLEVKSTPTKDVQFQLSRNEFEVGCEKGLDYLVFIVTEVDSGHPTVLKLPNLFSEEYDFLSNDHFSTIPDGYVVFNFNLEELTDFNT